MKIDKSIIDLLKKHKQCDDVIICYKEVDSNLSRFGENRITQNMSKKIEEITVKAVKEERVGSAVTTKADRNSLLKTLKNAESIASTIPKDPEFMPPLQSRKCKDVNREVEATARITPLMKAKQILRIIERAKKKNAIAAGYFYNTKTTLSILNTKGFFCSHTLTNADFSITVSVGDSSGFADASDEDIKKIDAYRLFRTALHKAEIGINPVEIKPGNYPVLLEPIALGRLMWVLYFLMDKRVSDEGWSFFSKKEGKKIASTNITIFSDPYYPENPGIPFDFENDGIPLKKHTWIKNGILNKLWTNRYWAKKRGIKATGVPSNLIMNGTNKTNEEIIKKVNYGLLVTRLWYIRFVNRKELILTGMTRDGLFLVENGKISKAVKNMRFNDSPFTILSTVKYLGKPERVEGRLLIPSIFAERFHFASTTKF